MKKLFCDECSDPIFDDEVFEGLCESCDEAYRQECEMEHRAEMHEAELHGEYPFDDDREPQTPIGGDYWKDPESGETRLG